jgi:nucleoside 2-deoxyribosyltransferase
VADAAARQVDTMGEETSSRTGGLSPQYRSYERQKCFVAHSHEARWRDDILSTCNQVLPEFGLEPWYAADHFDPIRPLRDKMVELIANTRYGIYDVSYWRKDNKGEWVMPRNVLIELGVAIALNRPTLLLRHAENRVSELKLPKCLESVSENILEFSGSTTLQRILREHLARWANTPPERDWWNRYCIFGNRICEYREAYPHGRQWGQETIRCHISDGQDTDRPDFRGVVEEVLGRFSDVAFEYLDGLPIVDGYDFLLCTHCQTVRSTPFAIYRITPQTPAETFLAIGMSLALETQFTPRIPKILLTTNVHDVPSLLSGYEVVEARNDQECKTYLRKFLPAVIQEVRKTTWRPRPLPFIEVVPGQVEKPTAQPNASEGLPEKEQNETTKDEQSSHPRHIICMVAMPYGDQETFPYNTVLLPAIREVLEQAPYYWQVDRSDDKYFAETIGRNISEWVARADVYIAEISDGSPNVMMELGFMLEARKPEQSIIVLMREGTEQHLADLAGFFRITYPDARGTYAVEDIAEALRAVFAYRADIHELNKRKQAHYLSPLVLRKTFRITEDVADKLAQNFDSMENFVSADVDEICRLVPGFSRDIANGLKEEVTNLLNPM